MKLTILRGVSLLFLLSAFHAQAQLRCPPITQSGQGSQRFDVSAGVGVTLLYGDINANKNQGMAGFIKGDYNIYKGFYAGLEAQFGKLKAKGFSNQNIPSKWDPREVDNSFTTIGLNVTAYPYRFFVNERDLTRKGFFERNILNGFNIGLGMGMLFNNYKYVNRETTYSDENGLGFNVGENIMNGPHQLIVTQDELGNEIREKRFSNKEKSTILPKLNIGFSIPLNKYTTYQNYYYSLVINSQFNFSNNDLLDGYEPLNSQGQRPDGAKNDMYNFTNIGVKVTF